MAMIKCPECGKEMSDRASACPNCGCPIEDIRQSLEELEAERNAAARKKEDEKKAKEVAASIRKKRQEEARKAVTPEMKRKRGVIAAGVTVAVVLIGILGWYFGIKIPKEKAYDAYVAAVDQANTAAGEYNDSIDKYNAKAKEVISVNDELDTALTTAQILIDCGDEPFEGEKITTLSNTVKDARNNKIPTPSLKEVALTVSIDEAIASKSKGDIETASQELLDVSKKYMSDIPSIESEMTALTVPDYSETMVRIVEQTKDLEDSYAIQKQITAPEEDWVVTRLGRVEDIASIAPVTEENDPNGHLNKDRGYTATVYFMSPLLGTENLTGDDVIDKGTVGGGAVEVYRNTEDAESRDSYLGALDGGILSSGSHRILGTMVIRTSDDLKASQQETLTNAIVAAMTELD